MMPQQEISPLDKFVALSKCLSGVPDLDEDEDAYPATAKLRLDIIAKMQALLPTISVPEPPPPGGIRLFDGNDTHEFVTKIIGDVGSHRVLHIVSWVYDTVEERGLAQVALEDGTEYWCLATRVPAK